MKFPNCIERIRYTNTNTKLDKEERGGERNEQNENIRIWIERLCAIPFISIEWIVWSDELH